VRRSLRGESVVSANERLEIVASKPHGDVDAVLRAMRRLNFASLLIPRSAPSTIGLENRMCAQFSFAGSPTMWSGTCARHGRSCFLPTRIRLLRPRDPVAPERRSAAAEEKASPKLGPQLPHAPRGGLLDRAQYVPRSADRSHIPVADNTNDLRLRARELIDKITP
jgi:hypothetical protein